MHALYVDSGSGSMVSVSVIVGFAAAVALAVAVGRAAEGLGYSRWWGLALFFPPLAAIALVLFVVARVRERSDYGREATGSRLGD